MGRAAKRGTGAARRAGLAVAMVSVAGAAMAQGIAFSAITVTGNTRVADATVLRLAGIAPGAALSRGEINDAAQALRDSGLFAEVNVRPAGNTLVIEVVERATVNRINIEGNASLSDEDLLPAVRSQPRRVFSPAQAEADAEAIAQIYASQGRINATVSPRIIPRDGNRVDLVFEVNERGVTEIERIGFLGNRSYGDARLRRVLETKQAGLLRGLIQRDTYSPERVARDRELLTDFYRSRGYADFQILNVDVALTRERDAYLVTYNLREGQQFRFGAVTLASQMQGVDAAIFSDELRTARGDIYSPGAIDNDINRIEAEARRRGVNFLTVEPRLTRNQASQTIDLTYVLVQGPRLFVERIDVSGNGTTEDSVIRNQFRVVEGDPFNPREIRESARRIRALGLFADVDVNAVPGSSASQTVIDVDVVEGPTGSLSFGANYNTESGLGLVASYAERNFRGRGQRLAVDISTAEANRQLTFSFDEPNFLGRDLSAGVDLNFRTTDNENANYDTTRFGLKPNLSFPISELGRLQISAGYEFTDLSDYTSGGLIIQNEVAQGRVDNVTLGYSYSFDNRRGGLNPDITTRVTFAQELGFGDTQYLRTTALAGAETGVFGDDVTLRATLEGGYLEYFEGSSRVTDRFFLGGRQIRGFEAGGIGPRDATTDEALGGNAFAVLRLETEFPLGLPSEYGISGGAFIDYGSVWEVGETYGQPVLYNDFTPRAVAGLSLFWTTPIGPLRFNFTEPLQVEENDRTRNFDVTVSTRF